METTRLCKLKGINQDCPALCVPEGAMDRAEIYCNLDFTIEHFYSRDGNSLCYGSHSCNLIKLVFENHESFLEELAPGEAFIPNDF